GFGLGKKLKSGAYLELALGYLSTSLDIPGGTADVGNSLDPWKLIYSPYAGSHLKTDMEAYMFELSITQDF
ncbi:MAG: hypothetical protein MI808_03805, partial [Pseudomonadales bacterium]|nr:hypothetical protein [Pseudomonadales bacterium]